MKTILRAAGAAVIALSAGLIAADAASAAPAATAAGPKQPIPYAELNAYLKASPKIRAHKDWWNGQTAGAETGASANTSATAPSLPADTAGETKEAAPQLASPPPVNAPAPGPVNPPAATAPGAPDVTTPPK